MYDLATRRTGLLVAALPHHAIRALSNEAEVLVLLHVTEESVSITAMRCGWPYVDARQADASFKAATKSSDAGADGELPSIAGEGKARLMYET